MFAYNDQRQGKLLVNEYGSDALIGSPSELLAGSVCVSPMSFLSLSTMLTMANKFLLSSLGVAGSIGYYQKQVAK